MFKFEFKGPKDEALAAVAALALDDKATPVDKTRFEAFKTYVSSEVSNAAGRAVNVTAKAQATQGNSINVNITVTVLYK